MMERSQLSQTGTCKDTLALDDTSGWEFSKYLTFLKVLICFKIPIVLK